MKTEVEPLLYRHWREIAHFQDIELNPDWKLYQAMDDAGVVRIYTARTPEENKLIGYAVFFVRPNVHYSSSTQAVQDILYIDKERRGFGRDFIKWCDEQLKSEGVQAVYHHVKAQHNWGVLLERMGYSLVDLIYTKRLDKGK